MVAAVEEVAAAGSSSSAWWPRYHHKSRRLVWSNSRSQVHSSYDFERHSSRHLAGHPPSIWSRREGDLRRSLCPFAQLQRDRPPRALARVCQHASGILQRASLTRSRYARSALYGVGRAEARGLAHDTPGGEARNGPEENMGWSVRLTKNKTRRVGKVLQACGWRRLRRTREI